MALEDYVDSEVAVAVAAVAALLSPPVRRLARQGLVGGLAGVLAVADAVVAAGQGIARNAGVGSVGSGPGLQDIVARPEDGQEATPASEATPAPPAGPTPTVAHEE